MSARDVRVAAAIFVASVLLAAAKTRAEDVSDDVRALFPRTEHWFRIVDGLVWGADADGGLVPDYATLTHPRVRRADGAGHFLAPRLPDHFGGVLRVASGQSPEIAIELLPRGARDVLARLEDGLVVYAGAYEDTDVLYKATPTHLDEYLLLRTARAPTEWRYRADAGSGVVGIVQAGNSVEVVDARGAPWLRAAPPVATDANGARVEGTIRVENGELVVSLDLTGLTFPVLVDPDWMSTGDMAYGRYYHQLTPLADGRFLATGGCSAAVCSGDLTISCRTVVRTAETLDLMTRTFSRMGDDPEARFFHAAARLDDGTVLVAGGCATSDCATTLASAAVFHPHTAMFEAVGSLAEPRAGIAAAPLPGGRVLVAGGCTLAGCTSRAEAYDPVARTFVPLAAMRVARGRATVSPLPDGRVLIAGGCTDIACAGVVADAEVYDPSADRWTATAPMATPRAGHHAATLLDGRVLVGGGCATQTCASVLRSAELFDPVAMRFDAAPDEVTARFGAVALLLPDGSVMISEGCESRTVCDLSNEVWDPATGGFRAIQPAITGRAFHATVLSFDASTVVANGGCEPGTCSWWNETYDVTSLVRPDAGVGDGGAGEGGVDAGPLDASAPRDAGRDGGTRRDAGGRPVPVEVAGCGCRVPVGSSSRPAAALALVAIAWLVARCRRRRAGGAPTTGRRPAT